MHSVFKPEICSFGFQQPRSFLSRNYLLSNGFSQLPGNFNKPFKSFRAYSMCCIDTFLWLLQQSVPDQVAPPLPAFLTALKEGFKAYEVARSALLDEDTEQGRAADPDALQEDCPDEHEKCPFWASVVSFMCMHAM